MNMEDIEMKHGKLFCDGKYYQVEMIRGKPIFKDITKDVEDKLEVVDDITDKLYKKVDAKKILKEALMRMEKDDVNKLYMMLFKDKKQYKVKTREHHCCDLKVGNFIVPIIE